jgi:hypothetical protein
MGRPRCDVCQDDKDCELCDEWVMARKIRENKDQKKITAYLYPSDT